MYSHEELISAVNAAGRDGKTFTVKDVRAQLGFDSRDKKEQSRFRRRLRAFEKAAADQLEKLADNSYRLRPGAFEQLAVAAPEPVSVPAAVTTPAATAVQLEVVPETLAKSDAELPLEPASGVFQSAVAANEPAAQAQPAREAPALHVVDNTATEDKKSAPALHVVENPPASEERPAHTAHTAQTAQTANAAYVATPSQPTGHSVSTPQRVLSVASALVSGAFAASAAVSGKVRERSRNLREQLWSCVRSAPARKHAFARLRGWAESVRPLSNEVREQLSALRQRVLASRRRAA